MIEEVDAYDLLLRGVTPEDPEAWENGDIVTGFLARPPGVTVTGMVRRPAIYELHEERKDARRTPWMWRRNSYRGDIEAVEVPSGEGARKNAPG